MARSLHTGDKVFFRPAGMVGRGIAAVSKIKHFMHELKWPRGFIPSHVEIFSAAGSNPACPMLWGAQGMEGFIPKPFWKRVMGLTYGVDFIVVTSNDTLFRSSSCQRQLESMHGDRYEDWGKVLLAGVDGNQIATPLKKDCVEAAIMTDVAMGVSYNRKVTPCDRENMTPLQYLDLLVKSGWSIEKKLPPTF